MYIIIVNKYYGLFTDNHLMQRVLMLVVLKAE